MLGIKKWFFNRALISIKKNSNQTKSIQNFASINEVLLIARCGSVQEIENMQNVMKYFQNSCKHWKISSLIISANGLEKKLTDLSKFHLIIKKDLNWIGIPNSESLNSVSNKDFQVIIDISPKPHSVSKYLTLKLNAAMIIGPYSAEMKDYYDFMISDSVSFNPDTFAKTLLHYLKSINQKSAA